jgi:leucyl aminopeptidase
MDFELKTLTRARICAEKCDALVVLVPQLLAETDGSDALTALMAQADQSGDFERKPGKLLQAYRTPGLSATRLVLAGVGEGSARNIKTAVAAALAAIKGSNAQRVVVCASLLNAADAPHLQAALLACGDAAYSYTATKSKPAGAKLQRLVIGVADLGQAKAAFHKGVALVKGIDLAREWGNRPANHATPTLLAGAAKALGKLPGIKVEILGPKEVAKLGMGSFMAVAKGSEEPLRFIVLRYDGADKAEAPVVLVGKGITFDSGGISIKPAAEMDEMKFDMCGAASVLGTFRALAELQPALNVVGLIPACENLPDGRALKPGDVVTSMSGQTIEILNTDAEGRLVLCDALSYAERFKPRAVVDIATLTGACVVALGAVRSGMFASHDDLALALSEAGDRALDLCWRLPLDDDYAEGLKTNFADVANVAGRAGGAISAAKFLQRFTSKFAWAHLDIAGTAWRGGAAKGATGRPVGLLVEYLLGQVGQIGQVGQKPRKAPAKVSAGATRSAVSREPGSAVKTARVSRVAKAPAA